MTKLGAFRSPVRSRFFRAVPDVWARCGRLKKHPFTRLSIRARSPHDLRVDQVFYIVHRYYLAKLDLFRSPRATGRRNFPGLAFFANEVAPRTEIALPVFKKMGIFGSALLLICGIFTGSAFASSSNKVKPVASLSKLDAVLAKSIKQQNLPSNLTPTLTEIADSPTEIQGSGYLRTSCDPYVVNSEAKNPVPCWYGSPTAKRTVVVFGDSFVGNWIPALNIAGTALGFRVAEYSFVGCNTPFISPAGPEDGFDEAEVKACTSFHNNLPKAVNKLDPIAVIAADGAPSWGASANPVFIQGLNTAFNEMSTPTDHPARILMGAGPHLSEAAPSCLATHPSSIQRCNFTYTAGSDYGAMLARDTASISGAKVDLIPTYQWFCLHDTCPAVIGNIDVYADSDHITIAISQYLSVLLEKALTPLLNSATS